ncbi:unnamed protein product, partial [Ixodes hexagonus]
MNELLGWYGYEKAVDSRDTQGLNLTHFAAGAGGTGTGPRRCSRTIEGSSSSSSRPPRARPTRGPCHRQGETLVPEPTVSSMDGRMNGQTNERETNEHKRRRCFSALIGRGKPKHSANLPPNCILCAWCQKVGMKLFTLKTTNGSKTFCSELCFTQCRRASFKKNKVCDWCKHVRHTVNYVDFQDGEQQLQFCSDKCLNQYKMNIFCRETQAHLQMHPHLQEAACKAASGLITPELWLRDCKSQPSSTTANGHDTADEEDPDERRSPPPLSLPVLPSRPSQLSPDPGVDPVNLSQKTTHKHSHRRRRMPMPDSATRPPFLPPHPAFHMLHQMRMHHHNVNNHDSMPSVRSFLPPPPGVPRMGLPRPPLLPLPAPNPLLPPPTVMVPYPIFLPIPIPIPIPIPLPFKETPRRDSQHVPRRQDAEVRDRRRRRMTPEHDDMRDSVDTEDDDSPRTRPVKSSRRGL